MLYKEFVAKINEKGLQPYYVIEGDDAFWSYRAYRFLLSFAMDEMDISTLNTFNLFDLQCELENLTMFGGKRFVVLRDYTFEGDGKKKKGKKKEEASALEETKDEGKALRDYISTLTDDVCLIIYNCKNHKIKDNLYVFNRLQGGELRGVIEGVGKEMGLTFSYGASALLAEYCLNDMSLIYSELTKLSAYGKNPVDMPLIREVVVPTVNYQYFDFADKVAKGLYTEAYKCLEFLTQGKEGAKVPFLTQLAAYYRMVWFTKHTAMKDEELGAKLNRHPYAVKLARQVGGRYNKEELTSLLKTLYILEYKVKSGKVSVNDAIDLAIGKAIVGRK